MYDMINYVPSAEEAYYKMPDKKSLLRQVTVAIAVFIFMAVMLVGLKSFSKIVYHRVLYQWQAECLSDNQKGYGSKPCNYWNGARP